MKTEIIEVRLEELKLLDKNARFMTHEMFTRLVENIKRDGCLTQLPFVCKEPDGTWKVLSGNHRVAAAKEAGLEVIQVIATEDKLTESQKIAIQLSHNAISGEDDPVLLKELYETISSVDDKIYCGFDDKTLELLEKISLESICEPTLAYHLISLIFFPRELKEMELAMDELGMVAKVSDGVWGAKKEDYEGFAKILADVGKCYNVKNVASQVRVMFNIVKRHYDELADGYKDESVKATWVPLASIFGNDCIPVPLARKLLQRLEKEVSGGAIQKNEKYKLLELLTSS